LTLLETTTSEGAIKGMVTARAPHELQEQEVAYLQDGIINQLGFVNRRGAIQGTTAITAANLDNQRPVAFSTIYDPNGTQQLGVFYFKDTGTQIQLWVAVFVPAPFFTFIQKHYILTTPSYPNKWGWVQLSTAIDGSLLVSFRYNYNRDPVIGNWQTVAKWYGACPTNSYAAGAALQATVAATEGSTSITGAAGEIAKISFPGMIISGTGVVKSVTSTTQVELMYPSPRTYAATATNVYVTENLAVARARGKVSCTAAVLTGVVGYGTKFTEARDRATIAGLGTGFTFWDAGLMKVLATLTANTPAVAASDTLSGVPTTVPRSASMKNYIMYANENAADANYNKHIGPQAPGTLPTPKAAKGSFFATYKGYMISFNATAQTAASDDAGDITPVNSRAYVHGPRFPEIMDHTAADGDWFDVGSTTGGDTYGVAVVAGTDAVVLAKHDEAYALTGDTPDDFFVKKIADDGALHFDGVATWRGRCIWVGRNGIWMYSAAMDEPENILQNTLGPQWNKYVGNFLTSGAGADSDGQMVNVVHAFCYRDYLFVNVMNTSASFTPYQIYTDGVLRNSTNNQMQLMIYMPTRAVSFLTNFNFQSFCQMGGAGYVLLPQKGSTTHHIFPVDNLFVQGVATVDTILTSNAYDSGSVPTSVGPWFHMESRKYDIGDGLRRKTWKQLSIQSFISNTKRIFLETVPGLNTTGTRAAVPYTGAATWQGAKVRFNSRGQYMSFRLYEDINNRPSTLQLGAWQWGYKVARRGQV
jgi:hypothetical protein